MTQQRALMIVVLLVSVSTLFAQAPRPTFEVASIKKLDQAVNGFFPAGPPIRGGTVSLLNSTVESLIRLAYGLRDFQVVGGSDWMRKDLYEVYAKAAGEPSRAEVLLMLQALLADRFGLSIHTEQRDTRFFALVSARDDGRLGPYLLRMTDTGPCDRKQFEEIEKTRPKPSTGYAMAGFGCGSLAALAEVASLNAEWPVFDKTGLSGRWSGELYFAPDPNLGTIRLTSAPDPSLASFSVALQEQFGLKLEPTRGPVDVLVVDSVRQPTEN